MSSATWKRPMTWVLAVSVVLNIFLGAAFLGRAFVGPPRHGPDERGGVLRSFLREAPPEMRGVAERIDSERRDAIREERRKMREAFESMRGLIRSDPFDRAGLEAAQAAARGAKDRSRQISDEGVLELLSQMSAEDRTALAERLERRWRERRERWKDRRRERDRDERVDRD